MVQNWTKIVVTLGPATDSLFGWELDSFGIVNVEQYHTNLVKMLENGARIFRFNLSHGSMMDHIFRAKALRDYFREAGVAGALMFDTKGPELRIGAVKEHQTVRKGDFIRLYSNRHDRTESDSTELNIQDAGGTYNLTQDVRIGTTIYVEDGKLVLTVTEINPEFVLAMVETPAYTLKKNKRVNLKGVPTSLPFFSPYDVQCIQLAAELGVEYLALSFVQHASEIKAVRDLLRHTLVDHEGSGLVGHQIPKIVAKIETQVALDNIAEIIAESDAVMIARGDLALNTDFTQVPYHEEAIIRRCQDANIPVIVATQMLDSLERNPFPTRAEIMDVYQAVAFGADATMLSGETAQGFDPEHAVDVMAQIIQGAEQHQQLPKLAVKQGTGFELAEAKKLSPGLYVVANPGEDSYHLLDRGVIFEKATGK